MLNQETIKNPMWTLEYKGKIPKLRNPLLIEGLPGIGNVGKMVVDFLIDSLNAKKIVSFSSNTFPHSVFVNEKNLVELPSIDLYAVQRKKGDDFLLLAGDVQPVDEVSCYEFCYTVLDLMKELGSKKVMALGGIGLKTVPKKPKVFITGAKLKVVKDIKKGTSLQTNLYGVVGPIIGVSGVLVGLAPKRNIDAVAILAETFGHPMYLGVKSAREILKILDSKYHFRLNLKKLDKEIVDIENEMLSRTKELSDVQRRATIKKLRGKLGKEMSYIG